jgi:glycosyltransferase involved in cell wall biosynthesis
VNKSLTIVLPVHNAETRLQKDISDLLELGSELTSELGILIIDDGSTDDTSAVASELASRFPQVKMLRHRQRQGLGAIMQRLHRHVRSDAVMLHDGATAINAEEVRRVWRSWIDRQASKLSQDSIAPLQSLNAAGVDVSKLHSQLERAHRTLGCFQMLSLDQDAEQGYTLTPRLDRPHTRRAGIGILPTMPRPRFLRALAEFAIGE